MRYSIAWLLTGALFLAGCDDPPSAPSQVYDIDGLTPESVRAQLQGHDLAMWDLLTVEPAFAGSHVEPGESVVMSVRRGAAPDARRRAADALVGWLSGVRPDLASQDLVVREVDWDLGELLKARVAIRNLFVDRRIAGLGIDYVNGVVQVEAGPEQTVEAVTEYLLRVGVPRRLFEVLPNGRTRPTATP